MLSGLIRGSSCFFRHEISGLMAAKAVVATSTFSRCFATAESDDDRIARIRNFGISAHIDSGKTTLTERILYYTKKIRSIHEVKGKDGVGATMDSMDLEREKGITIQSAATHCIWKGHELNIIDTPGHVDFTVEVERALRVLDGAILVLCGVGGVQSQSITVDRQMKRYNIPRLAFINKLDRQGANPARVIGQLRDKLHLNASPVVIPIGLEDKHRGVVDLVRDRAVIFNGPNGDDIQIGEIPADLKEKAAQAKNTLIERLSEVDEEMGELFLMEQKPTQEQLVACIRRCTLARTFVPVFMGSAFKNKGVQLLLDGVNDYLPAPNEVENTALDLDQNEKKVTLSNKVNDNLVALAFKLEENKYGQLTYLRMYQGKLSRGDMITNMRTRRPVKVSRLVRMHANSMEDIQEVGAGEIAAIFGIDCASGDTFTNNKMHYAMSSMFVPDTVISLAVKPHDHDGEVNFSKALQRFTKEDPTFQVDYDKESKETIIKGMGELHLQIYIERMKREYNCAVDVGYPRVNYRETISKKCEFNYLHKKQSGGSGQFGRVIGYIEPMDYEGPVKHEFVNNMVGNNIPPEFLPAIEKGFYEAIEKGRLLGYPVTGIRFVLLDGQSHSVDSNEIAFRTAAKMAVLESMMKANPLLLEPLMSVEIDIPQEFQGAIIGGINRRKGAILATNSDDRGFVSVEAEVPLSSMFGYSTELRSNTQGQGEFTMEFKTMTQVPKGIVEEMVKKAKGNSK